jgi:RecB family endonuclease NucS
MMNVDGKIAFHREVRATLLTCGADVALDIVSKLAPEADAYKVVEDQIKYLAFALVVNEGEEEAERKLLDLVGLDPMEVEVALKLARRSAKAHRAKEQNLGKQIEVLVSA